MERPVGATSWRIAMATTAQHRIAVAFNEEALNAEMAVVRNAFLLALPAVLVLIAAGAWWMATRALRPVHELAETIQTVTAQGLDQRVAASAADREFADLIEVFNAMLERLERGFRQASRFSADAAHELKTPLAILQGELERLIQSAEDGSSIQVALCGILDEVRRLSVISRKLLLLSLADSGGLRLERRQLDLSRRLTELVEDTQLLAPALRVTGDIPAGLAVEVDANLVEQIFHNLVSNAIKYNIEGGWIHVAASRSAREVFVSVSNSSHGLSGEDAARVFERFYRGDRAHGRAVDGVGLGLSLSREIARAHGGELTLESGSDHRIFVLLTLPYASPGDPMPSPAMPAQSAEGTASAQTLQAVRAPSTSIRKPVGL
jgi:signal transduction histidine kinase